MASKKVRVVRLDDPPPESKAKADWNDSTEVDVGKTLPLMAVPKPPSNDPAEKWEQGSTAELSSEGVAVAIEKKKKQKAVAVLPLSDESTVSDPE